MRGNQLAVDLLYLLAERVDIGIVLNYIIGPPAFDVQRILLFFSPAQFLRLPAAVLASPLDASVLFDLHKDDLVAQLI